METEVGGLMLAMGTATATATATRKNLVRSRIGRGVNGQW